jgi:hypothetical protein
MPGQHCMSRLLPASRLGSEEHAFSPAKAGLACKQSMLCRYQLIYAVGDSIQLTSRKDRILAAQVLLHLLADFADRLPIEAAVCGPVERYAHMTDCGCKLGPRVLQATTTVGPQAHMPGFTLDIMLVCRPGGFCGLRLLPGEVLTSVMPELTRALAKRLLARPPLDQKWLAEYPNQVNCPCTERHPQHTLQIC